MRIDSYAVGAATIVMVPLVTAAWLPQGFPHLLRRMPDDLTATALVSHMGVIVVALYVVPLVLRGVAVCGSRGSDVVEKM